MDTAEPTTVEQYLAAVPPERRELVDTVRATVLEHLPPGFEEGIQHGMLDYHIPLETFADTYNGKPLALVALANQKQHVALYLMGTYGDEAEAAWFKERWKATGAKLDMGKSCVRFKRLEDVPLDVVGEAVSRTTAEQLIEMHQLAHRR